MALVCKEPVSDSAWSHPPEALVLQHNEIHVWRLFLSEIYKHTLSDFLAADELTRARQFHFTKDRENFIAVRGTLRLILGSYLNIAPERLKFCYNDYGKPALPAKFHEHAPHFNVSHSHNIALIAIARDREVGVDIEYIRSMETEDLIAEQFFSPREFKTLRSLPAYLQQTAFFTCWARKEAYIKAVGKGLTIPLDQFDVELRPGEPADLLNINGEPGKASHWTLHELFPADGYVAALAVEDSDVKLKCWQWRDDGE